MPFTIRKESGRYVITRVRAEASRPSVVICTACDGYGEIEAGSAVTVCPVCDGRGEYEVS